MLLKTPDVTIVLLSLAILSASVPGTSVLRGIWILVPVGLVMAVSSQDPANLGLRRVLLVYPFLFLWIGERSVRIWELVSRSVKGPLVQWAAAAGLLLVALSGHLLRGPDSSIPARILQRHGRWSHRRAPLPG